MPKGQQPNKEELESNIQGALTELEGMTPPNPDDPPEPKPGEEDFIDPEKEALGLPTKDPETPPTTPKEPKEPEENSEPPKEPETPPTTPTPEEKLRFSTAEAQVLTSQNRRLEAAILEAAELPEPTDEEMQEAESEWEDMTPNEQRLARRVLHNERKNEIIAKAGKEGHAINEWGDKVDVYLSDPETLTNHPEIEGREEAFKTFAIKPTRRGADFEDLISAFLYSQNIATPPAPKKPKMFETGGAAGDGERPKPNDGKLSLMEGRRLRITNYDKYVELLRAGKIDNSEI